MASAGRQQPPWRRPDSSVEPRLHIYNSLTRSKTPFTPLDPSGKKVTWYACGPTVYDDAHLGHARNYVTTDIIRRIMMYYFGFDVNFVMNITDVDDKIILRGRQQHLLEEFRQSHPDIKTATEPATKAYHAYAEEKLPNLPKDLAPASFSQAADQRYGHVLRGASLEDDGSLPGDKEAKVKMHLNTLRTASEALSESDSPQSSFDKFISKTEDVLLPYLDSLHGASVDVTDHGIFTKLTQKYERRFNEDMKALNTVEPDRVTRVTEYGPQIVEFVKQIVDNGFAYQTPDGSVYFDIDAFEAAGKPYARLEPWNRGDNSLQADGEGALTKSTTKRSKADFALWKSSRRGEPYWPSPWGKGRPGWHIECSAMATDVLGRTIDIHSGGIDLAFPHHDNELAQSEAYCNSHDHQWINYFMHMGHLSIQGSKMSKSLKNFTTIRNALEKGDWTSRSLRIVFLLGSWKDGIEITDDMVKSGASWEDKVNNFFYKAKMAERKAGNAANGSASSEYANGVGHGKVLDARRVAEKEMNEALSDSFDTPNAMQILSDLITKYNTADKADMPSEITIDIASWLTRMVRVFGLDENPVESSTIGWSGIDILEAAKPFVYPTSELRDEIRKRANRVLKHRKSAEKAADVQEELSPAKLRELTAGNAINHQVSEDSAPYAKVYEDFRADVRNIASANSSPEEYLALCDQVRDIKLWNHNIYLEDALEEGQPALVRPLDKGLVQARAERDNLERAKQEAKTKREQEQAKRDAEKNDKAKQSHLEMFKTAEFSAWDSEGMPTKDADGQDVAKSKVKKLRKLWEAQKKAHEEWKRKTSS
ncbi:MAG: hypothetical protein M1831_001255 [Alyxoria varia]|nr:MAG: hypothetical protein M1831_001255 [Alyxoria varia]